MLMTVCIGTVVVMALCVRAASDPEGGDDGGVLCDWIMVMCTVL